MSVTIKQTNPRALRDLLKRYRGSKELAIGYPLGTDGVSTRYPDGTPVLLVAASNNFGAPSRGIPARDFMSQGGVRALEKTQPLAADLVKKINRGDADIEEALEVLGPVAVAEFQQTIVDIDDPPNAESTISAKGSSNPLVDGGQLVQSLTFIVRGKR